VQSTKGDLMLIRTGTTESVCATDSSEVESNPFMVAEPWLRPVAGMWLEIGYVKPKLEIYTLGRRRARNGKARCRDEMVKYIENCRSGGREDLRDVLEE